QVDQQGPQLEQGPSRASQAGVADRGILRGFEQARRLRDELARARSIAHERVGTPAQERGAVLRRPYAQHRARQLSLHQQRLEGRGVVADELGVEDQERGVGIARRSDCRMSRRARYDPERFAPRPGQELLRERPREAAPNYRANTRCRTTQNRELLLPLSFHAVLQSPVDLTRTDSTKDCSRAPSKSTRIPPCA